MEASMESYFGYVPPIGGLMAETGLTGNIISHEWLENVSVSLWKGWSRWLQGGRSGISARLLST